jgi:tRNA A37 N6-isopentenylltransferase MiaA
MRSNRATPRIGRSVMSRVSNAKPARNESVPELVKDDEREHRDYHGNGRQRLQRVLAVHQVTQGDPAEENNESRVDVDVDTRDPPDSPRPSPAA